MPEKLRASGLILEDNPSDVQSIVTILQEEGIELVYTRVASRQEYRSELNDEYDIILADQVDGQIDPVEALEFRNEAGLDIPFIIVSSRLNNDCIEGIREGADDFVLKDELKRIGPAVRNVLESRKMANEKFRTEQKLRTVEERLRDLAENANDIIYYLRLLPEWQMEYISPAVEPITGLPPDRFYREPNTFFQHIHPADRPSLEETLHNPQSVGEPHEIRWRTDAGETIWLEHSSTPIFNDQGEYCAIQGIARDITERKKAEKKLRRSRNLYRKTLEAVGEAVFVVKSDQRIILSCNPAVKEVFGYEPEELIGDSSAQLFLSHDDFRKFGRWSEEVLQESEVFHGEFHMRHASGDELITDHTVTWLSPEDPEDDRVVSIVRDITEQKQAQEQLRESEERFRQIAENIQEVFWVTNPQTGKTLYVSPGYEEITGRNRNDLYEDTNGFLQYVHPEDRERIRKQLPKQETGEFDETYRIVRSDGSVRWLRDRAYPITNDQGTVYRLVGVAEDVTELMEAQEALRESEELFRGIVENMEEGFYRTTPEGKLLVINPQFARLLGYESGEEIEGKYIRDLPPFQDYPREEFRQQLEQHGNLRNFHSTLTDRKGNTLTVRENAHVVRDDQGEIQYYEGTIMDISEQQALEEQLIQAQKVESLGEVAAGIAHDFNNALTVLGGMVQMIEMQYTDGEQLQEYLDIAGATIEQARAVTDRLLTFTRSGAPDKAVVSLGTFAEEIADTAHHTLPKNISIGITQDTHPDKVLADKIQLQQVMMNLCINASHAMEGGGSIEITVRQATEPEIRRHISRPEHQGYLCIDVADTGSGIDPEVRERIFEPFFTTKERGTGTGLGLAVAHKIMHNHDGWIDFTTRQGEGTTFTLGIPAAGTKEPAAEEAARTGVPDGAGERILLIEDNANTLEILSDYLNSRHYEVSGAPDGTEGIQRFEENPTAFDVVITDLGLPGMSGEDLARQILSIAPETKIIAITGYVDAEVNQKLRDEGFHTIIRKPLDFDMLLRSIGEALGKEV